MTFQPFKKAMIKTLVRSALALALAFGTAACCCGVEPTPPDLDRTPLVGRWETRLDPVEIQASTGTRRVRFQETWIFQADGRFDFVRSVIDPAVPAHLGDIYAYAGRFHVRAADQVELVVTSEGVRPQGVDWGTLTPREVAPARSTTASFTVTGERLDLALRCDDTASCPGPLPYFLVPGQDID